MNVAIVTHVYATGPAQELEAYLKQRAHQLLFLGHPFVYRKDVRSFSTTYRRGALVRSQYAPPWRMTEPVSFAKDLLLTLRWILASKTRFHLYFGADNLNALAGLVLKKMGFAQKVVFYSIDFVPRRFNSRILNHLYHLSEKFCLRYSTEVWNLSAEMTKARKSMHLIDKESARQTVVPIGVSFARITRRDLERVDRFKLVYMGHLREGQGLRLIFDTLPRIFERWPAASLLIIGTGPLEHELVARAKESTYRDRVVFMGYVEDHRKLEEILSEGGVGLALYEPSESSISWYTDPSKPKQYMACGLPVIITVVPPISKTIQGEDAGVIIDYDQDSLISALQSAFDDASRYETLRSNAISLAAKYEWDHIFDKAIGELTNSKNFSVQGAEHLGQA